MTNKPTLKLSIGKYKTVKKWKMPLAGITQDPGEFVEIRQIDYEANRCLVSTGVLFSEWIASSVVEGNLEPIIDKN